MVTYKNIIVNKLSCEKFNIKLIDWEIVGLYPEYQEIAVQSSHAVLAVRNRIGLKLCPRFLTHILLNTLNACYL
jgi:hypothetical protein